MLNRYCERIGAKSTPGLAKVGGVRKGMGVLFAASICLFLFARNVRWRTCACEHTRIHVCTSNSTLHVHVCRAYVCQWETASQHLYRCFWNVSLTCKVVLCEHDQGHRRRRLSKGQPYLQMSRLSCACGEVQLSMGHAVDKASCLSKGRQMHMVAREGMQSGQQGPVSSSDQETRNAGRGRATTCAGADGRRHTILPGARHDDKDADLGHYHPHHACPLLAPKSDAAPDIDQTRRGTKVEALRAPAHHGARA